MRAWLQTRWYSPVPPLPLLPLAWLYGRIAAVRRRRLLSTAPYLPVPVIVVGNVTVGGTGKTPFVIWLVEHLRRWGWNPGVVSRGYGGRAPHYPHRVDAADDPRHCGDEPLLIARRTAVPVVVDPDRVAAVRHLVKTSRVDIVVSDDGLQHYRLARHLEICIVDGARGLGNGALLPAGPLREPPERLREVDLVVVNGDGWTDSALRPLRMHVQITDARSISGNVVRPLADFRGRPVHAVAGIGHPARFFAALRARGLDLIEHAFADHQAYDRQTLAFGDDLPVLMTEKDAVKCAAFAAPHWWQVPAQAQLAPADAARVQESVSRLRSVAG